MHGCIACWEAHCFHACNRTCRQHQRRMTAPPPAFLCAQADDPTAAGLHTQGPHSRAPTPRRYSSQKNRHLCVGVECGGKKQELAGGGGEGRLLDAALAQQDLQRGWCGWRRGCQLPTMHVQGRTGAGGLERQHELAHTALPSLMQRLSRRAAAAVLLTVCSPAAMAAQVGAHSFSASSEAACGSAAGAAAAGWGVAAARTGARRLPLSGLQLLTRCCLAARLQGSAARAPLALAAGLSIVQALVRCRRGGRWAKQLWDARACRRRHIPLSGSTAKLASPTPPLCRQMTFAAHVEMACVPH